MRAVAEQLPTNQYEPSTYPALYAMPDLVEQPRVYSVQEAEFETEAQVKFQQWLGSLGLQVFESTAEKAKDVNLLERLKAANAGSEEAKKSLAVNVDTAIFEAVFKDDYIGDTYMDLNERDELMQHGQTNDSIYRNAINLRPGRHDVLEDITRAEALNRHRIEAALKAGKLKDHYFVAFSLVPDGVPEEELGPEGDGYFLDSLTLSAQATTELARRRVKTETALTAGVEADENDTLEDRINKRHDFPAVAKLYEWFDQEAPSTAERLLNKGLYIPKEMMPNGIVDVRYWLDMAKDEVLGRKVNRKVEDYVALRLESKRRQASLKDVRHQVLKDLQASTNELKKPMQAVQRMWKLIRIHATKESFTNLNIDPKVFGAAAAPDIVMARYHIQQGNGHLALDFMRQAQAKSVVTGCGGGSSSTKNDEGVSDLTGELSNSSEISSAGSDKFGSLKFKCPNGHINTRERNKLIDKCQHKGCTAKVKC